MALVKVTQEIDGDTLKLKGETGGQFSGPELKSSVRMQLDRS